MYGLAIFFILSDIAIFEPDDPFSVSGKLLVMGNLDNGHTFVIQGLQGFHNHFALVGMQVPGGLVG